MSAIDSALRQLESIPEADRLLYIEAIEEKRKRNHFAKYWSCGDEPNYQPFFEQIARDLALFTQDIKVFLMLGGNRSSKTERGAFIACAWLLGKDYFKDEPAWKYVKDLPIPERGVNIWVVGLDFTVVKNVLWGEKLRQGLRHPGLIPNDDSIVTRISDSEFQVSVNCNGRRSTLTCKSADSGREKFQSASVDLIWIDEECDAEIFDECYQRTTDCAGKILVTLTPLNDVNSAVKRPWVYELYQTFKRGAKNIAACQLSVLDNPFIPENEKKELKIKWAGHPEERARLYGDFIQRQGLVYKMWRPAVHLVKRFPIPREYYRLCVIDPAPTGPSACGWFAINPTTGDVLLVDEYKERELTTDEHAKNILVRNAGEKIDLWLIDPRGGAQRNAETHRTPADLYRDQGIPVRYAKLTEDYGLLLSMQYLNAALDSTSRHPKFQAFDDLPQFRDEIETYVWDAYMGGQFKGMSKNKPRKGNDDLLNCYQYACCQLRGRKPPQGRAEYQPTQEETAFNARLNSYT